MSSSAGWTVLDSIERPSDLRELNTGELETLAAELREFIVRSVSVVGGHLGSNLGVVKLTLAIHRVFDSPKDIVLWDTGRQAYVHKHDWVENSHASTVLSYAHGLAVARLAAEHDGPTLVHALTHKGRGYGPAENDGEKCLHDAPVFDPRTGPPPWAPAGYTQAFAGAIVAAGERDPRVVAITAAMAGPTGLRRFQERWPERFFHVGIAEQHAVTVAAGMALGGLRPVVALYSTFLSRAIDQINLDDGLHQLPVVFCIDRAGITGDDGPSYHGVLDMALLSQVPGLSILAPSSAEELRAMLDHALELDGPVAIRYPKGAARSVPSGAVSTGLRARLLGVGDAVCILAVGKLLEAAEEAARLLGGHGVKPTVWDVRAVNPLDGAMLASALAHRVVVTAEDGVRRGGAGSAIETALSELAREHGRPGPCVLTLGLPDVYLPQGRPDALLSELGLDGPGLAATALSALGAHQAVSRV